MKDRVTSLEAGMVVEEITFDEILPIWRDKLWPNRQSPIEPASSMLYLGGYDLDIKTVYKPRFFAVKTDYHSFERGWKKMIIGVNSGHQTSPTHYRSRGIWVGIPFDTESQDLMRLRGTGRMLIRAVEDAAREAGCSRLWSIPRESAMPFYAKCGFEQTSPFFDETMEFGPNAYCLKSLESM